MYFKYEINFTPAMYSEYDRARREYLGEKMNREDISALLDMCGIPHKSPKIWDLLFKYQIIFKEGKGVGTRYFLPKDLPPFSRFRDLEKEFYDGHRPAKKEKPKETRTILDEDFCIRYLKARNYVIFKVEPDFDALSKVLTPEFLLKNSGAQLK